MGSATSPLSPRPIAASSGRRCAGVVARTTLLAAAAAFTAIAGYYRLFAYLAPWDDEGYLLVSLRAFLRGGRLYDDVYSQYGPFYFELMGGLFRLLGLEVCHDDGRLVTLAVYLLASLLCGIGAALAARSVLAGALVHLLVFRLVWPSMALEPMHPGGLVCLLLAGLVPSTLLGPTRPALAGVLQGALGAALLFVKINVGAFALLALAVSTIPGLVAARRRWLAACLTGAAALLPPVLMASQLGQSWVRTYALLGSLSILAVALALWSDPAPPALARRHVVGLAAGTLAVSAAVVAVILGRGSSLNALVDAILLAPRRHVAEFTWPFPVPRFAPALVVCGFLACPLALWRARRASAPSSGRGELGAALLRLGVASALVLTATGMLEPHCRASFWLACTAWVASVRPRGIDDSPALAALRRLVPPLAALQLLHAYPVAGSQVAWSSFLLVPVGFLCALDGWRQLVAWVRARGAGPIARPWFGATVGALLLVLVTAESLFPLVELRNTYQQLVSLGLPGTRRVRVAAGEARMIQELVRRIKARCETFVTMPGLNSLYLWTEREPPTDLNATLWMVLFDTPTQERIVARLQAIDHVCLVRRPKLTEMWARGLPMPERPLLVYLRTQFAPFDKLGDFELCARAGEGSTRTQDR